MKVHVHTYNTGSTNTIATVTFNGTNLTKKTAIAYNNSVTLFYDDEDWFVNTPPTVNANVVVTLNSTIVTSVGNAEVTVDLYQGADLFNPLGTVNSSSTVGGTSLSTTITTTFANSLILNDIGGVISSSAGTVVYTNDPNVTQRSNRIDGLVVNFARANDRTTSAATGYNVTTTASNVGTGVSFGQILMELIVAQPTATPTSTSTSTVTPTFTSTATPTFTATPTTSPTFTSTVTATPTSTSTMTPTFTSTITKTSTNTITLTPSASNTTTPTATSSSTTSPTPTITPVCDPGETGVFAWSVYPAVNTLMMKTVTEPGITNLHTINAYFLFTRPGMANAALYTSGANPVLIKSSGFQSTTTGWNTFPVSVSNLAGGSYNITILGSALTRLSARAIGADFLAPVTTPGVMPPQTTVTPVQVDFSIYGNFCP